MRLPSRWSPRSLQPIPEENPLFDAAWYLDAYPDVAASSLTPWRHYRLYGSAEGRRPNRYFDAAWYLREYPQVQRLDMDPLDHYLARGWREGMNPGPSFDTAEYLAAHPSLVSQGLNPLLHLMRSGLGPTSQSRGPMPPNTPSLEEFEGAFEDRARSLAAAIDRAFLIGGVGVFLSGWLLDPRGEVVALRATTGSGVSANLLNTLVWTRRPDVISAYASWDLGPTDDRLGFVGLARTGATDEGRASRLVRFEFESAIGRVWRVSFPVPMDARAQPLEAIRQLLAGVPLIDDVMLREHVGPAVHGIWSGRERKAVTAVSHSVGPSTPDPTVSIVVPVYGRYDLVEYQLSQFANDRDLQGSEIIYVVDDPKIGASVLGLCWDLWPIYRVPCRVVLREANGGFAAATNSGVEQSRAGLVLMLNSDVMPMAPGWLSALTTAYRSLPVPGPLGVRLIYPDGSLQHDGLEFVPSPAMPGIWLNKHPGKGLPPGDPGDHSVVEVPAASAACLMVGRELFDAVGGLDESYPIGDFEDSDFCLKLRRLGHPSYVARHVVLWHLERQSQHLDGQDVLRRAITLSNAWLHAQRWSAVLTSLAPEEMA